MNQQRAGVTVARRSHTPKGQGSIPWLASNLLPTAKAALCPGLGGRGISFYDFLTATHQRLMQKVPELIWEQEE